MFIVSNYFFKKILPHKTYCYISYIIISLMLEMPKYSVIKEYDKFEIREYEPSVWAEVKNKSNISSFRILADYIFGNNSKNIKMNMTAPVRIGEKFSFFMESKYGKNLPVPNNKEIKIKSYGKEKYAVIRFSGLTNDARVKKFTDILISELKKEKIKHTKNSILARYDGPYKLPILRRNEVMVKL